jgi:hypothetical protein
MKQYQTIMKTSELQLKSIAVLSVLAFATIVAISPHAFAQQAANLTSNNFASNVQQGGNQISQQSGQGQQNGIPLGSTYNAPAGSPQNQIPAQVVYNDSDNPTGPLQGMGWAAGMVIVGVMSGVGVWTAVRRR